jgi:hypothetical protein
MFFRKPLQYQMKAMIIHIVKKFKEEDRELMIKNILKNHKKKLIKFELN